MARQTAASLLDGDDEKPARAPAQDPAVWDRAGEDAKREKRGEPPLTDAEWNEMRADGDTGEIVEPEEPAEAPPKGKGGKGGKGASAAVKAAADRAEKAHEEKKAGKAAPKGKANAKLPGAVDGDLLAEKTAETKKRRGRKAAEPEDAEEGKERDSVRKAIGGNTVGIVGGQILSYVERYERLEEEAKSVSDDKKEILAEAKGNGFDTKIILRIVKTRKMDKDKMDEEDSLFELYMQAIENAEPEEE